MTLARRTLAAPLLALTLMLPGCLGGVLGGGKPARLYRFGGPVGPASAAGPVAPAARALVVATPVFAAEVAGTRLLTVQGGETSYLGDARWVAPAPSLFAAAVKAGFAARAPGIAVLDRRGGAGDDVLHISIERFEAAYAGDGRSAPTVRLEGEAWLADGAGAHVARYRIVGEQPAEADRVGPIVAAFDGATTRAVAATVDWAAQTEATRPPVSVSASARPSR